MAAPSAAALLPPSLDALRAPPPPHALVDALGRALRDDASLVHVSEGEREEGCMGVHATGF